jgi:hypothetical protein
VDPTDLIELYKMATEEYRFEVNLSWDAVRFFTTLNVGILGFGSSLLGLQQLTSKIFVIPIFIIGIVISIMAIQTRKRYREYYLRSLYVKTLIEDQLQLHEPFESHGFAEHRLAISPTEKVDNPMESLKDPESWVKKYMLPLKTVTSYQILVFIIFGIIYASIILLILYSEHYLFLR